MILILCLSSFWLFKNYLKGWNYDQINFVIFYNTENGVVEDNPSTLSTEKVNIFHRDLSIMTIKNTFNDSNE